MTSRIHSIAPRVAIAVAIVLVPVLVGGYLRHNQPYSVPAGTDIFAAVQGTWAWTTSDSGCATDPHTITFAADHKVMTITATRPYRRPDGTLDSVAVYDIHAYTRSWIRGAIRGETRMTANGRPVVWDLVLKSPDRYAWHRTDWHRWGYTREILRCLGAIR
ncbi:MAG TPA: hypothetical protein VFU41_14275 [Gemmatimonadales bacterium]|nr:hypothetical protein [Gemmatimonadales bacterium]